MNNIIKHLKQNKTDYMVLALLAAVSIIWRKIVWESSSTSLANIELITTSTIIASLFLKSKIKWLLPLITVAISDTIIPNSRTTALHVWSAWAVIGLLNTVVSSRLKKTSKTQKIQLMTISAIGFLAVILLLSDRIFSPIGKLNSPLTLMVIVAAIGFSIFVLAKSKLPRSAAALSMGICSTLVFYLITNFGVWLEGWYPSTIAGLIDSYIKALPFLERQMRTSIALSIVAVTSIELVSVTIRNWAAAKTTLTNTISQ